MDVMFTTHPKDGPGDYYMVVASKGEWEQIIQDLNASDPWSSTTEKLIRELGSWGVES